MPPEEKGEGGSQEEDAVRHLRDKLYSRKNEHAQVSDIRTPLPKNEAEAPVSWTPAEESAIKKPHYFQPPVQNRMSLPAKFLLGSVLFFILAAGAAAYMFFGGGNLISPQNIDIQTVAPSLIDSGKAATFQILINNRNTSALNLADLIVDYPSGTRDPAKPTQALQHERQSIGTINPGEQVKRTISGIFFWG